MINVFIYRLKSLIKNKELVFWVMLFPILLVTLFNMAFSNFGEFSIIGTLNVGIVRKRRFADSTNYGIGIYRRRKVIRINKC